MHKEPNAAPAEIATIWCIMSETPMAKNHECGVTSPAKCPKNKAITPI